jgi:hypothetical protein
VHQLNLLTALQLKKKSRKKQTEDTSSFPRGRALYPRGACRTKKKRKYVQKREAKILSPCGNILKALVKKKEK